MSSGKPWTFVDNHDALRAMLNDLDDLPSDKPDVFMDIERDDLSGIGQISIVQLFVLPKLHVFLIDILHLGSEAFTTPNRNGLSLQGILEAENVRKAFFDVRNDSAALYRQYKISLANVDDIQLMENATRSAKNTRHVSGLVRCIERDASMSCSQKQSWTSMKESGKRLFDPERGGTYAIFNQRPLTWQIQKYCIQDVLVLPILWNHYSKKLNEIWRGRVSAETRSRITASQSPSYNGKGQHMALAPWSWNRQQRSSPLHFRYPNDPLDDGLLRGALQTMQNLRELPVDELGDSSIAKKDSTSVSTVTEEFLAISLKGKGVSDPSNSTENPAQPQHVHTTENSSGSVVLPVIKKADDRGGHHLEPRSRSPYKAPSDTFSDNDDDDDRYFFTSLRDEPFGFDDGVFDTDYQDFTACSADDCGYCGHCPY